MFRLEETGGAGRSNGWGPEKEKCDGAGAGEGTKGTLRRHSPKRVRRGSGRCPSYIGRASVSSASKIRLALVDDHPTLLRGLAAIFGGDGRYEVVATGASAEQAVEVVRDAHPGVLIVDLSMPGDVFAAIEAMTLSGPTLKIVVFTAFANVELALRAMDAGAHAFVLKGSPSDNLHDAIATVLRGDLYVSPEFSQKLVAGFRKRGRREAATAVKLSTRERELVDCLLEAKSNKEIARTLNLTEKTVKHYMTNLMNKLKVRNRVEVVIAARTMLGPVPPGDDFARPHGDN